MHGYEALPPSRRLVNILAAKNKQSSLSPSLSLYFIISLSLYFIISLSLFHYLSLPLSISLSLFLSLSLSVYLSFNLSASKSIVLICKYPLTHYR
jgi:hypothetical protein